MSDKVRIGMIGAGGISQAHLQAIQKEERAEAVAIADVFVDGAKQTAEKFNIPRVYENYQEMIEKEELDAVIACVPNFLHAPVTTYSLSKGKHVLSEKPMALNVEEALHMKESADRAGKVLMVAQNNRFRSETQLAKKWVMEQELGRVYHAKTGWVRRNGIPGWGSWFTQKDKAGGGPLIDVGVHVLDLTLYIMGYPKPVSVWGKTYDVFGPQKQKTMGYGRVDDQGKFDVEDLAIAVIHFENGATLTLDASWASFIKEERVYCELLGDQGGASLDLGKRTATLFKDDGRVYQDETHDLNEQDDRLALLTNFLDSVQGKAEPICKPEESITVQRILDAIYRSAETGELIKL
ncbi:Gfo/Idh/MocA family protein [Laceyella putida]|uniref:Gfo/Idh/MocA family protein n=1 Tax=Laceyella putida TaxID=110101 RepID=A0ABW2RJR8_9BACL